MKKDFLTYCAKHQLITPSDRILVAVSAGLDSMVLLHLMEVVDCASYAVAHCNFNLRIPDAQADEDFLKQYCIQHNIPFFSEKFNTKTYATTHKISTQMAARDLRYAWFSELAQAQGYNKIAIATHADDVLETFYINLFRGSALKGLSGIKNKRGNIIRPLLFAQKQQLKQYAEALNIPYREDVSNATDAYLRNKIRHHLVPLSEEILPGASQKIIETTGHLWEYYRFVESFSNTLKATHLLKQINNSVWYSKKIIDDAQLNYAVLHHVFSTYHFNTSQIQTLIHSRHTVGAHIASSTHTLWIERDHLAIEPNAIIELPVFTISPHTQEVLLPSIYLKMLQMPLEGLDPTWLKQTTVFGIFELEALIFPLTLRPWKAADAFVPYGMQGKKKIGDFLSDLKVSVQQKKQTYVLEDAHAQIVWVLGYRIADFVKLTLSTKQVFCIKLACN